MLMMSPTHEVIVATFGPAGGWSLTQEQHTPIPDTPEYTDAREEAALMAIASKIRIVGRIFGKLVEGDKAFDVGQYLIRQEEFENFFSLDAPIHLDLIFQAFAIAGVEEFDIKYRKNLHSYSDKLGRHAAALRLMRLAEAGLDHRTVKELLILSNCSEGIRAFIYALFNAADEPFRSYVFTFAKEFVARVRFSWYTRPQT